MEHQHFSTKHSERPVLYDELSGHRGDGYQSPILVVPHTDHERSLLPQSTVSEQTLPLRQERVAVAEEIQKFANPAPLGLCAFALTSFIANSTNVYLTNVTSSEINIALPLVYGGFAQLFAGIWEMVVGNTFGATSFCSYGAYWITFGIISLLKYTVTQPDINDTTCMAETMMGVFMMAWFIFTTLMLLCTLKSSLAMFLLFFFLDMNYLLLGIAHIKCTANEEIIASIQRVGGVFGILAALMAWYNAFAGLFDHSNGFFTVPLGHFPWSPAARAHGKVKAL